MRIQGFKFLISLLALFIMGCSTGSSIVIDAPIDQVWSYVGDSSKARDWSVYFHHITAMPGPKDGEIGAKRRCFRKADETGMYWDEDVVEINKPTYRQIHTYNINGYREAVLNEPEYKVEQIFEPVAPNQTKLTFKASLRKGLSFKSIYYIFRDYSDGKKIFSDNLENIKARIEGNPQVHPYEEQTKWD